MSPNRIVGLDPDTHNLGCAANFGGRWIGETRRINGSRNRSLLHRVDCAVAEATAFIESLPEEPDVILLERPEVQGVHRIGALVPLAFLSGALYGHLRRTFPRANVVPRSPAEWKNPIPKDVFERRLKKRHPAVYIKLAQLGLDDHALDAAGLILNFKTGKKL